MAKMRKLRMSLRIVTYKEREFWLAHCLETDVVAEGTTPAQAVKNLMELSEFQIRVAEEDGDVQSIFRPAPPQIWKMFMIASELKGPIKRSKKGQGRPAKAPKPIGHVEIREFALV